MQHTYIFLAALSAMSCASEPDQNSLDLQLPPSVTTSAPSPEGTSLEKPDLQKVFDWQKFYKKAPSRQDQKKISDDLRKIQSGSLADHLKEARNVMALGRRQEAKRLYENILLDDQDNIETQIELTHIYIADGNVDRAFDYLSSIKKLLSKLEKPSLDLTFRYRYALALTYIQGQNRQKGHEILTELLSRDPGFIPAYAALAQSYIEHEKFDVAEFISKRGLDKDPNDPRLLNTLAVIALRKNKLDECKIWIQKALEQNPDYVPSLINRANLAMQRREYAIAENDLKRSAELEPMNSEAQIAFGLLMKKTGRISNAKAALEKAVEIDPQNAFARYHLAMIFSSDLKDYSGALQLFYDVLQADEKYSALKSMAKTQIETIRDSRLYER